MIMPSKGGKPALVSQKTMAVIALINGGIEDETTIAGAVGFDVDEVRRIESGNDLNVRKVAVAGLPNDFLFRLRKAVVCPRCGSRIFLVPCLSCRNARFRAEAKRRRSHLERRHD